MILAVMVASLLVLLVRTPFSGWLAPSGTMLVCGAVLLYPVGEKASMISGSAHLVLCVALSVLVRLGLTADAGVAAGCYTFAVCLPLCLARWIMSRELLESKEFLASMLSGREVSARYGRDDRMLYYSAFSALAMMLCNAFPEGWPAPLCFASSAAVSVILAVRLLVGSQPRYGPSRAVPRISADTELSVPVESGPTLNYKLLYGRLEEIMDTDKPFLSSELTMDSLARKMYTNRGYLSRMINSCTGMNFNQYVNSYRVRHAMRLFQADRTLKIGDLSVSSGFRNKVTFIMAFKLFTGKTPRDWCEEQKDAAMAGEYLSSRQAKAP